MNEKLASSTVSGQDEEEEDKAIKEGSLFHIGARRTAG